MFHQNRRSIRIGGPEGRYQLTHIFEETDGCYAYDKLFEVDVIHLEDPPDPMLAWLAASAQWGRRGELRYQLDEHNRDSCEYFEVPLWSSGWQGDSLNAEMYQNSLFSNAGSIQGITMHTYLSTGDDGRGPKPWKWYTEHISTSVVGQDIWLESERKRRGGW